MKQFISVHIPKTGGTVFLRRILKTLDLSIVTDYKIAYKHKYRKGIEDFDIIHGHFFYQKYEYLERPFVVWLREPTNRIVSHYSSALRKKNWVPAQGVTGKTLIEFAEMHSNTMTKHMGNRPISDFAFVGVLEKYNKCIVAFSELMGIDPTNFLNIEVAGGPKVDYTPEEAEEIRKMNEQDYILYEEALKLWS